MSKAQSLFSYLIGSFFGGLVIGPIVTVMLGFVWMWYHELKTGIDAGNAPPFFCAFGLLVGPIVAVPVGYFLYRRAQGSK
jgi:uncharacterized protein YqgC (DUF456 family)